MAGTDEEELSLRELDRLAGNKSEAHASLIESGQRPRVEAETAMKYARVLGTTLDWLLLGTGDPPTAESVAAAVTKARRIHAANARRTGTDN